MKPTVPRLRRAPTRPAAFDFPPPAGGKRCNDRPPAAGRARPLPTAKPPPTSRWMTRPRAAARQKTATAPAGLAPRMPKVSIPIAAAGPVPPRGSTATVPAGLVLPRASMAIAPAGPVPPMLRVSIGRADLVPRMLRVSIPVVPVGLGPPMSRVSMRIARAGPGLPRVTPTAVVGPVLWTLRATTLTGRAGPLPTIGPADPARPRPKTGRRAWPVRAARGRPKPGGPGPGPGCRGSPGRATVSRSGDGDPVPPRTGASDPRARLEPPVTRTWTPALAAVRSTACRNVESGLAHPRPRAAWRASRDLGPAPATGATGRGARLPKVMAYPASPDAGLVRPTPALEPRAG